MQVGPVGVGDERKLTVSGLQLGGEQAGIALSAQRGSAHVDPHTLAGKRPQQLRPIDFGECVASLRRGGAHRGAEGPGCN